MGSKKNYLCTIIVILSFFMTACFAGRHKKNQTINNRDNYASDTLKYGKDCIEILLFLKENIYQEPKYKLCFKDFSLDSLLNKKRKNENIFAKADTIIFRKYLGSKLFNHMLNNVNYFNVSNYTNDTTILYLNCTDTLGKFGQEVYFFIFDNNTKKCINYTKHDPWPMKL